MSLTNLSLRHPVSVLVAVVGICLGALLALREMPRDVFPSLGVPTIYVAQPYGGMDPAQMEGYLTYRYEYHFLYISGIEHVESKSIQGASIMKLQFQPGTDMSQAMSETVAQVNRSRAFMPPGTVPPFVMRFDAGSVAVGYLVFSTDNPERTLGQMQDQALNRVRPLFATLPGVSAPPPFGGSARSIVVDVDPERMRALGLTPDQIVEAVSSANVVSPSGNINLGDRYPIVRTNAIATGLDELSGVVLRRDGERSVFLRDVANVTDGADITTSYALANGRRTVYLPVTKRSDASTLDVVETVKSNLSEFQRILPPDIQVSYEFDQSPVVDRSIADLVREGGLGALLTGLMVLLFLRDWRSALVVVVNIPIALLAAVLALWLSGNSIHLMTLGGLALAVGILVDEATVTVENVHSQLERGVSAARAALDGARETAGPRLLAMLSILAVFIPAVFMEGAARALFVPMALAVGFAMVASYLLSSTLVPVLSARLLRSAAAPVGLHASRAENPGLVTRGFVAVVAGLVRLRFVWLVAFLGLSFGALWQVGDRLGLEIFPRAEAGQFALRVRAPAGTQVERTEERVQQVLRTIEREAGGAENIAISIGMVGVHGSSYPVNLVHLWNGGPEEAWLAIQMAEGFASGVAEFTDRLRGVLAAEQPDLRVSFEPQDIVSRVMSFGSPTPIEVAVSGPSLAASREHAEVILAELRRVPFLRDVQIAQTLDYPTVDVDVDRERAGLLGVTEEGVVRSLVAATTSSRFTRANYWADPRSGVSYSVQVQIPQSETRSLEDLANVPVDSAAGSPVLLRNVATISTSTSPGTYERYNMLRVVSVTANVQEADLGTAARAVRAAITAAGTPGDARTRVDLRGQVQPLQQLLDGFQQGLLVALLAIVLLLAAHFESWRLSFAVFTTLPAVLAGVALSLWLTGTTVNIQSAIGAIMAVGVAVANAILLVTFAERRRRAGEDRRRAAVAAVRARVRPILMTSLAMCAGMLPLALGLGEAGEQTAPLGRAVLGGLVLATFGTLFVLPASFAILARPDADSLSLDPEDPDSLAFDGVAILMDGSHPEGSPGATPSSARDPNEDETQ